MIKKIPCRRELVREGLERGALIQATCVIVNVHREQARAYRTRLRKARVRACFGWLKICSGGPCSISSP
ncbi:MAG: hypothetical protein JWP42_1132 [Pseudomonas sp.]|nr:hypothetical protein [Pseudomonas sp.]